MLGRIRTRVQLVDATLYEKKRVGNLDIDPNTWEETRRRCLTASDRNVERESMDAVRKDFLALGMIFRPRLFSSAPESPAEV